MSSVGSWNDNETKLRIARESKLSLSDYLPLTGVDQDLHGRAFEAKNDSASSIVRNRTET
jgi:hypothetical protein